MLSILSTRLTRPGTCLCRVCMCMRCSGAKTCTRPSKKVCAPSCWSLSLSLSLASPLMMCGLSRHHAQTHSARLPVAILNCSAVSREINFSSAEEITQFRLEQRVFLEGSCIEGAYEDRSTSRHHPSSSRASRSRCRVARLEWLFAFGYVIPGSTNTWQQTIESAGAENMLDPKTIRCVRV